MSEEVIEKVEEQPQEETPEVEEKKDRTTEQFEKLTKSNQELKEERDKYKNLFEGLRPKEVPQQVQQQYTQPINQAPNANQFANLSQGDINQVFQSMVDSEGYLDGNKLMQTLQDMNERAQRAESEARSARQAIEEERKERRVREENEATLKVYEKYPQLDPQNEQGFDSKFWEYVYNELAMKAKAGTMPSNTDYMKAADKVYEDFYQGKDMKSQEQAQKTQEQKTQINAVRPQSTVTKGYYEKTDQDALIENVRAGKRGALAEMLRRRGQ